MFLASFWCCRPSVLHPRAAWLILQPAPASSSVLGSARDVRSPVLWGGSLGVLPKTSVPGWRTFLQDLQGSSSGASSPSFSFFRTPSTWHRLLPAPFLALPLLPSFWRVLSVKLLVPLGLILFGVLSVLGTVSRFSSFQDNDSTASTGYVYSD